VVQVRQGVKTIRVPAASRMVRQHIRLGLRHDPPSDEGKGFEVVHCQQQAEENLGGVYRKLPDLFSAERFLHQAGGSGQATEAGPQRVVQGLHDRHAV